MKVSLPIEMPFIVSYKHHALKLAVYGSSEGVLPWIASNFIQLYTPYDIKSDPECDPHWLDFYLINGCDEEWLNIEIIETSKLQRTNSVELFIEKVLNSGSYIYLYCDSFYLPYSYNHKLNHYPSNLIVYGYDSIHKYFHILDYNFNGSGKLEKMKVPYDLFLTALSNLETTNYEWAEINHIYTPQKLKKSIDLELVKSLLEDYIYSKPSIRHYEGQQKYSNSSFGMSTYESIHHFLGLNPNEYLRKNILPFSILCEHKKVINLLIDLLCKNGTPLSDYKKVFQDIEQEVLILRNLVLKYNFTNNKNLIPRISSKLKRVEQYETNYLPEILENI